MSGECGNLNSGIYKGWVRHRRFLPRLHEFRYRVFMMYLDMSELDRVFSGTCLWSVHHWTLARFKREDFVGDPAMPLDEAVRQRVESSEGVRPAGPIRMLANLRYFGFIMNPIVCYYCFDETERLQYMVAEVTNTPWNERHSYVLNCDPQRDKQRIRFKKHLHVSPFNPMDIVYRWRSNKPGKNLYIHMENVRSNDVDNTKIEFDATLILQREEICVHGLRSIICRYPLMTIKVVSAIYWQGLRILIKRIPFYAHPKKTEQEI